MKIFYQASTARNALNGNVDAKLTLT